MALSNDNAEMEDVVVTGASIGFPWRDPSPDDELESANPVLDVWTEILPSSPVTEPD